MCWKCALEAWRRAADPRRWPLTLRLTLFFSCAVAAILFAVCSLLYARLKHELRQQDETELVRAVSIESDVVRSLERERPGGVWREEWGEYNERMGGVVFRVLTPAGAEHGMQAPAGHRHAGAPMPVPRAAFPPPWKMAAAGPAAAAVAPVFARWRGGAGAADGPRYLLTAAAVETGPGQVWVVQAALDRGHSHRILDGYWTTLSLALAAAVLASGGLGLAIARHGLAPLRAVSAEIGRTRADQLHARIGARPWPSDLQLLANSFDAMLARLQASFEQLSRFSSDLAHEFRSPINNLVAAASVTLARERGGDDYRETLAVIVDEGERLSRMVSSMLFIARADNAQQAMHCAPLSAQQEFVRLAEFFDAALEDAQVSLRSGGDPGLTVHADALLLRRALSNLISNALRHTPPGGAIALQARALDGGRRVELSVRDSGCGIAAAHLPHLFERFYRIDGARAGGESTGLGLALVKSIAELHGGHVTVDSAPGQGARFAIVLPGGSAPSAGLSPPSSA
jgi:two-component system heavy metal sensor histidine kinase CusS